MKDSLVVLLLLLILISCKSEKAPIITEEEKQANVVEEYQIQEIKLAGDVSSSRAEISGMTWYKDWLVLLPQYPSIFSKNSNGLLYFIHKSKINEYLDGIQKEPILPDTIEFDYSCIKEIADKNGSGFEGIVFEDDRVFVTLEQRKENKTFAYVVEGVFDPGKKIITLEKKSMILVDREQNYDNFSEEALTIINKKLFTFYEANGINVNYRPLAFTDDFQLKKYIQVKIPTLEYRITDATLPDENNNIWLINYFYTGEFDLIKPGADSLIIKYGVGESHLKSAAVERLVELHFTGNNFEFTNRPPIQLKLNLEETSRNWEGIARLDDRGFLIVTDKYPRTILGFVEYKN